MSRTLDPAKQADRRSASPLEKEIAELTDRIEGQRETAKKAWAKFDNLRSQVAEAEERGEEVDGLVQRAEAAGAQYEAAAEPLEALEDHREALWRRHGGRIGNAPSSSGRPQEFDGTWLGRQLQASIGTGAGLGAAVTPTEHADFFFDALTPLSIGLASGFTVLTTEREKLHVPRLTTDAVAEFTAEGDELPLSDPEGDSVEVEVRKLGAVSTLTREAAESSEPQALAMAEFSLARGLALGLDRALFEGAGPAPEIVGLHNTSGVQVIDHGAALADLDPIADAIGALEEANVPGPFAIAMHPGLFSIVRKMKDQQGRPLLTENPTTDAPPRLFSASVWKSAQLDTATIYVYSPHQVVAVRRMDARIETDLFYDLRRELIGVRITARWGLAVPNPSAVLLIQNVEGVGS